MQKIYHNIRLQNRFLHQIIPALFLGLCTLLPGSRAQTDTFSVFSASGSDFGRTLLNPFTGGLNNPQLCPLDLDGDGTEDLMIFDRSGDVTLTFLFRNGQYEYAPDYQSIFPDMEEWALVRDYNKDGIPDLFTSSYAQGPQGVEVYKGSRVNGQLQFTMRTFAGDPSTMLNIPAGSSTTHLPVDYIDYPDIHDVDQDGDLDILSFGPNSGYLYWYRNMAAENNWSLDSLRFRLQDYCWGKFFESGISSEITLSPSPDDCANFRSDKLEKRHAGSTVLSWDLNNDGAPELLIGDVGSSEIVTLINGGTPDKAYITDQVVGFPEYDVPVDMPIFLASFAMDFDHDGDEDLLVAPNNVFTSENKNVIWRYENTGTQNNPVFRFRQDDFLSSEMVDVGFASAPQFVDFDQDGLTDIVAGSGGYYKAGGIYDARLFAFRNVGTAEAPAFDLVDEDYLGLRKFSNAQQGSYFFTPTFGDLDDDGDLDVIVGEIYGKLFFGENIAGPGNPIRVDSWVYNYMELSVRSYSAPFLVDMNEDGKLDLVIGARQGNNDPNDRACSNFYYFENIGTAGMAEFNPDPDALPNTRCFGNALFRVSTVSPYTAPHVIKTKDNFILLAGNDEGRIRMFTDVKDNFYNDFSLASSDWGHVRTGGRLQISLEDINDDGYLEMVTGNYRGGFLIFNTSMRTDGGTPVEQHVSWTPEWFPNPVGTTDMIRLDMNSIPAETGRVLIYDILGKLVRTWDLSGGSSIDHQLQPGEYLLRISVGSEISDAAPLIVLPD